MLSTTRSTSPGEVMRTRLISIGERMPGWVADGFAEYRKRLSRELPVDLVELPAGARGKGRSSERAIRAEGAASLAVLDKDVHLVVLDGSGECWSSEDLAVHLGNWRMQGRDLAFLIGGPDGHAKEVLARADQRWSLGRLTLPHMLVRIVVIEQLYRAAMLCAGHPYHRA